MEYKITIKHFLNTNLKPYIINGINYYSIYILITAKRRTTKLKSLTFKEYYSEADFNEIFTSKDKEDYTLIQNEINSINEICKLLLSELKEFDTKFLAAYINFSDSINIWDLNTNEFNKIIGIELDSLYFEIYDNPKGKNLSIFNLFNKDNRNKIKQYLTQNKKNDIHTTNIQTTINDIYKTIFYLSLDKFRWFIEASKKTSSLYNEYGLLFDSNIHLINSELKEKYNKD